MSKTKNPPKSATLTEQLRWYLKNCGTMPVEVSRQTGIHHTTIYVTVRRSAGLIELQTAWIMLPSDLV